MARETKIELGRLKTLIRRATTMVMSAGVVMLLSMPVRASYVPFNTNVNMNVGIGTSSPGSNLSVLGSESLGAYATNAAPAGGLIASGNVGIGTWLPTAALNVNGNIGIGSNNPGYALNIVPSFGVVPSQTAIFEDATPLAGQTSVVIRGGASTGAHTVQELNVENNGGATVFSVADAEIYAVSPINGGAVGSTTGGLELLTQVNSNHASPYTGLVEITNSTSLGGTSGTTEFLNVQGTANPSSGNALFHWLEIDPTVTQTGGANGITRGIFVNPVLTTPYDFRALETSIGNVGIGTISGNLGIGSQWPGQRLDVQGTARMMGFNLSTSPGNGYVLTSDSNGNGTWAPSSGGSSYWKYSSSGNIGVSTIAAVGIGTTFVGGTGEAALSIMNGNVGIGTWVPNASLQVIGAAQLGPNVVTVTQSATPSINQTNNNGITYSITGLAQAITSFTLTGTPTNGAIMEIQITDNGTARAISWGASIVSSTVTLPTTTVINTLLHVFLQYDSASGDWICIGVA